MPNDLDSKPDPHFPPARIPEIAKATTKRTVIDLGRLIGRYAHQHLPHREPSEIRTPEPPRLTGSHEKALRYLQIIPFALALLFVISFFWDTTDWSVAVAGLNLDLQGGLLRIISVSGLIGFLTNWLAITMLFQPRKPRPIFGQGLVPAQRNRVVFRLANAVSTELINADIIKQKIRDSDLIPRYRKMSLDVLRSVVDDDEFRSELRAFLESFVHELFDSDELRAQIKDVLLQQLEKIAAPESLSGVVLKTYRFFREEAFQQRIELAIKDIPKSAGPILDKMDPMLLEIPDRIEARADDIEGWVTDTILNLVNNIDVYSMVFERLDKFDEARLEGLIKGSTNEQLNYIKYLGGVLGLLGGLVIWNPVLALAFFGVTGGILVSLDELLFRIQNRP